MSKEFNVGWGESVAVRQAFLEVVETKGLLPVVFDIAEMQDLKYPEHEGDKALVELTRKIIKRQIGREYKHVLITVGATGGVTIALRAYHQRGREECITHDPPYFRFYPSMIKASGLTHLHECDYSEVNKAVFLVDSLSNPLGQFSGMKKNLQNTPIIWDSVYFSKVYCPGDHPQPDHDVLVGSYSKFTGLNGLRTGWIATNDDLLYHRMAELVTAEYCGVSAASTRLILETAGKFTDADWADFEKRAQRKLDYNREEWSKLEKFFGNVPVNKYGMFYYAPTDQACRELLKKSGIVWSPGSSLGTTDDFGRFNVGQDCQLVKEAVAEILKNDKR